MNATRELLSTGYLATLVQLSPGRLTRTLEALGVRPEVVINGIPHYSSDALTKLKDAKDSVVREVAR